MRWTWPVLEKPAVDFYKTISVSRVSGFSSVNIVEIEARKKGTVSLDELRYGNGSGLSPQIN